MPAAGLADSSSSSRIGRVALAAVALGAWGCVTTTVDAPAPEAPRAAAVVVPLAERPRGPGAADRYYQDVVRQMREAATERDLERLRRLLETHRRASAPHWAQAQMDRFAELADGLEFELAAARGARIDLVGDPPPIGEPIAAELRLELPEGPEAELAGRDEDLPAGFEVRFTVVDHGVGGTRWERRSSSVLRLERSVRLDHEQVRLPFRVELGAGSAVIRELRIQADLLPGGVLLGGRMVPHRRVALAEFSTELYPANFQPIRDEPLLTLRRALRMGDARHFPHVLLAAHFMPAGDREAAIEALIGVVRLGRPAQVRVAMAALEELVSEVGPMVTREDWLRWWGRRRRSR